MSSWTYITGAITVSPLGRTQAEKRYILDTVLSHLPLVTGSEGDMNVYVIQKKGNNTSCTCDEFGQTTNNLYNRYGSHDYKIGWLNIQNEYILVVDGNFRDRVFTETYREFQKWLCRLAKRVHIHDVLVKINGYEESAIITDANHTYYEMFEYPSWCMGSEDGEPNWCEYLMWEPAKNSQYPMLLGYKYYGDKDNDAEVERRINYHKNNYKGNYKVNHKVTTKGKNK